MKNDTITHILENYDNYDVMDLWYDWFCKESSLERKGKDLLKKLKMIAPSKKFDNDKCYVFFTMEFCVWERTYKSPDNRSKMRHAGRLKPWGANRPPLKSLV